MQPIYLDHNSTTPIDPAVIAAMQPCWEAGYLNPASQHRFGQAARRRLEQSRTAIAKMLGAVTTGMATDQLVFTSGGTESNNLALLGLATQQLSPDGPLTDSNTSLPQVLVSAIEHPSTIGAAEQLARLGFKVRMIPVDQHGVCCLDELETMIQQPTALVSLMLANNETGVVQPVAEAAAICRANNILLHTDAVQAVGKIPVNFHDLCVDALSLTAHKFNGPRGVGGLLLRHGVTPQPILFGGFQQSAIRPGTEDVALAVGMQTALELFLQQPERMLTVTALRDFLQTELMKQIPEAVVVGNNAMRLPTTLNIAFPGINRQSFLLAADIEALAVSTGSACASGSSELSPVLLAMGLPKNVIESAIRISLGVTNTRAEIEMAIARIVGLVRRLKST